MANEPVKMSLGISSSSTTINALNLEPEGAGIDLELGQQYRLVLTDNSYPDVSLDIDDGAVTVYAFCEKEVWLGSQKVYHWIPPETLPPDTSQGPNS